MRISFSIFIHWGLGEIGFTLSVSSGTGARGTQKTEVGIGQWCSAVFRIGYINGEASDICGFLDDLFIGVNSGESSVDFSWENTLLDIVFTEESVTRMTFQINFGNDDGEFIVIGGGGGFFTDFEFVFEDLIDFVFSSEETDIRSIFIVGKVSVTLDFEDVLSARISVDFVSLVSLDGFEIFG